MTRNWRPERVTRLISSTHPLRHKAPGRALAPKPKPPAEMKEVAPAARGLRGLLRRVFDANKLVGGRFSDHPRKPLELQTPPHSARKFLRTDQTTNMLYWYCTDLVFAQSDFERIGPQGVPFLVTRARDPTNLTRWMGYFLTFETPEQASLYFEHTLGHELCGFPLKLSFTTSDIPGYKSPLLAKTALPRKCHVLMLGLPHGFQEHAILRALWDFDLVDDDRLAVERMPIGKVQYGGNPILLRFKTEKEAARYVREFNREDFPHTNSRVLCEIVD